MITFNFYDYKRKFFTTEDIMNKEQVLRNIMKPNTWKQIENICIVISRMYNHSIVIICL